MKQYKLVEKYSTPTRLDKEPYGTIWSHLTETGEPDYYIQVGKEKENPQWIAYGDFLIKIFKEYITNDRFIGRSLKLYNGEYHHPATIISKIIDDRA